MKRRLLFAAWCAAAALAMLGVLEIAARAVMAWGGRSSEGIENAFLYSETLGWELRPANHFVVHGAPTSTNQLGFRGAPASRALFGAGTQRVVLLGDSVAFGYGVADDQTFAQLIDPDRGRFEVVNLAVPGYGVDQSLLLYERVGRDWRPAIVLLSVCVDNDLAEVMLPVYLYDGVHPKPRFSLQNGGLALENDHLRLSPLPRMVRRLHEHSSLYRRLSRAGPGPRPAAEHWGARRLRAMHDEETAVQLIAALIDRLRQRVERDEARLVLAFHPSRESYRHGSRWVDRLTKSTVLRGVQVVALDPAYRASGLGFGKLALDPIGHLSATGHALTAAALRRALEAWPNPQSR